jgi:hypothetical protein
MADTRPGDGNAETLRRYWTTGPGGMIKIKWGQKNDFTRCVLHLSKYLPPGQVERYCAERHYEMNGFWPGDRRNK